MIGSEETGRGSQQQEWLQEAERESDRKLRGGAGDRTPHGQHIRVFIY